jgi:hypothetical protein
MSNPFNLLFQTVLPARTQHHTALCILLDRSIIQGYLPDRLLNTEGMRSNVILS